MTALISPLPGMSRRTRRSAQATPKTVLRGTAIATVIRLSLIACIPPGLVIASKGALKPSSQTLMKMRATGAIRRIARYPSARPRSVRRLAVLLPLMLRPPALREVDRREQDQGGGQQHHRHRGGAGEVVALDLL